MVMANSMINEENVNAIEASKLFDKEWYLMEYPDVAISGIEPVVHYYKYGASLGRNPSPLFDGNFYLSSNPDVQVAGINPLVHYIRFGKKEGREARPSTMESNAIALTTKTTGVYSKFDVDKESEFLQTMQERFLAYSPSSLPVVTIIMPTWNRAGRIRKAIESVLAQNYQKFELLVCDDGSQDDTAAVVASLARRDSRVRYHLLNHAGVSAARNQGLARAEGGVIAYLDSDNAWRPMFLSTMVTFMLTEKLDCTYSGMRLSGNKYRGQPFDWHALLSRNYIDLNTFVHRRSLTINQGGFDETLRRMVDWDLISRYTKNANVAYAPFVGVEYDNEWGADRITSSESGAWEHIVRNKLLVDWDALEQNLSKRQSSRLSVVVPVTAEESATAIVQILGSWASKDIRESGVNLEFVFVISSDDEQTKELFAAHAPDNAILVEASPHANLAGKFNRGVIATSGSTMALCLPGFLPDSAWRGTLDQALSKSLLKTYLFASRLTGKGVENLHLQDELGGRFAGYGILVFSVQDYVSLRGVDPGCADKLVMTELAERSLQSGFIALDLDRSEGEAGLSVAVSDAPPDDVKLDGRLSFIDPFDDRVKQRLRALIEGGPPSGVPSSLNGISGAWYFSAPDSVTGWCINLNHPAEPFEVALTANDVTIATVHANQPTIARETGLSLIAPLGFRFDLSAFPQLTGQQELNIVPVNGGVLLPGKARVVVLLNGISDPELLSRIDAYVEGGVLASAYLLARNAAAKSVQGVVDRLLVLDFLLRENWHCYLEYLDGFEGKVRHELLSTLRYKYEAIVLGAAYASSLPSHISGMPDSYLKLLSSRNDGSNRTLVETLEYAALWNLLEAFPIDDDASVELDYSRIKIAIKHLTDEHPIISSQWEQLTALGSTVERVGQSSGSTQASEGRRFTTVITVTEPRYFGVGALGYLSALLSSGVRLKHSTLSVGSDDSSLTIDMVGRSEDRSVSVSYTGDTKLDHRAVDARLKSESATAELRGYQVAEATSMSPSNLSCLVFLDGVDDDASVLIRHARGSVLVDLSNETAVPVEVAASQGSQYALPRIVKYMDEHHVLDDTLVFLLAKNFQYPKDYIHGFIRKSVSNGNSSVVLLPVDYSRNNSEFSVNVTSSTALSYLGVLPLGAFTARDIRASLHRFPDQYSHVLSATHMPFIVVEDSDGERVAQNTLMANRFLKGMPVNTAEHNKGYVSDVLAHWRGAAEILGQPSIGFAKEELFDLDQIAALPPGSKLSLEKFPIDSLKQVATTGNELLAQNCLRRYIQDPEVTTKMSYEDLSAVIDACKFLGCQQDFADTLVYKAPLLVKRFPNAIIPIFEMFAACLPIADLNSIALAIAPVALQGKIKRTIFRLTDMCHKYCSLRTLFLLIGMIEDSVHRDMLTSPDFAKTVGAALLSTQAGSETIENIPNAQFYLSRAPLTPRVINAAIMQQREAFIRLVKIYFAEGHDAKALLKALRIYSSEITGFALRKGEIPYPTNLAKEVLLGLSILFGDMEMVDRNMPPPLPGEAEVIDDIGIIVASYKRDSVKVNTAFGRWGGDRNISTLPFGGDSIYALFDGFSSAPELSTVVQTVGRVSALITVLNPDLDLLRLSIVSILRQTYQDVEVILVDDGSDLVDPSAIEAMASLDERIKYIKIPKNSGPYVCRNKALEICTGAYVAIQDGDDYAHPQRFEKQVQALSADPFLKLCTTSHVRVDHLARFQFEHTLELRGDGTMTSMFCRDVFDVLGGFAQVRSRGDVEFRERLKAAYGGHVYAHIDYPLLYCYATAASLSNRTARNSPAFLGLFRDAFAKRMRVPVVHNSQLNATTSVVVPSPLRPE